MSFKFSTKAETLENIAPHLTQARLCEQITVSAESWKNVPNSIVLEIMERFESLQLAVRSSACNEDDWDNSLAGAHLSLIDVKSDQASIQSAINDVFASYSAPSISDQVLVQPMVGDVLISGVLLTRDLDTGGPYYVINYDDVSGRTDTVTGGADCRTVFIHRSRLDAMRSQRFRRLIDTAIELEAITNCEALDIEFCIDVDDEIYILQVRPVAARKQWKVIPVAEINATIDGARADIAGRMVPQKGLAGATTIFSEMSDWNPAEMIGKAPKPLALSLCARIG